MRIWDFRILILPLSNRPVIGSNSKLRASFLMPLSEISAFDRLSKAKKGHLGTLRWRDNVWPLSLFSSSENYWWAWRLKRSHITLYPNRPTIHTNQSWLCPSTNKVFFCLPRTWIYFGLGWEVGLGLFIFEKFFEIEFFIKAEFILWHNFC